MNEIHFFFNLNRFVFVFFRFFAYQSYESRVSVAWLCRALLLTGIVYAGNVYVPFGQNFTIINSIANLIIDIMAVKTQKKTHSMKRNTQFMHLKMNTSFYYFITV